MGNSRGSIKLYGRMLKSNCYKTRTPLLIDNFTALKDSRYQVLTFDVFTRLIFSLFGKKTATTITKVATVLINAAIHFNLSGFPTATLHVSLTN